MAGFGLDERAGDDADDVQQRQVSSRPKRVFAGLPLFSRGHQRDFGQLSEVFRNSFQLEAAVWSIHRHHHHLCVCARVGNLKEWRSTLDGYLFRRPVQRKQRFASQLGLIDV